jgi:phage antirepressor YoqD-like protein/phage regulator Rha-like protein
MGNLTLFRGGQQTMSSREIAKLTGKRHDHVLRDVRAYVGAVIKMERGESTRSLDWNSNGSVQGFGETPIGGVSMRMETNLQNGQTYPVYDLDKNATLTVVSGYNVMLRKAIIDRWQELEASARPDPLAMLNDPAAMRGLLLSYTERVMELAPKAEALDRIATASGSLNVTEAAKALQIRPKDLFAFLQQRRWIYRRAGGKGYLGYQDRVAAGPAEHKVVTLRRDDGSERIAEQVLITAKGLTKLAELVSIQ